jgi:hypothetical protein
MERPLNTMSWIRSFSRRNRRHLFVNAAKTHYTVVLFAFRNDQSRLRKNEYRLRSELNECVCLSLAIRPCGIRVTVPNMKINLLSSSGVLRSVGSLGTDVSGLHLFPSSSPRHLDT